MKSDRGEIEVFLCPEEESLKAGTSTGGLAMSSADDMSATDTDSEFGSPIKIKREDSVSDPYSCTLTPTQQQTSTSGTATGKNKTFKLTQIKITNFFMMSFRISSRTDMGSTSSKWRGEQRPSHS